MKILQAIVLVVAVLLAGAPAQAGCPGGQCHVTKVAKIKKPKRAKVKARRGHRKGARVARLAPPWSMR